MFYVTDREHVESNYLQSPSAPNARVEPFLHDICDLMLIYLTEVTTPRVPYEGFCIPWGVFSGGVLTVVETYFLLAVTYLQ